MKQLIPMDDYGIFADTEDTARANSLLLANYFNKRHDDVLRTIRSAISEDSGLSTDFIARNFTEIKYTDDRGRSQPCYVLTRDGFSIIAMGFTGKKAMAFKERYIKRFNEMEGHIASLAAARTDYPLLTDAVKMAYDDPKHYHFSNEADMLNRIITGYSAKQFREKRDIPKGESIRPYLSASQIDMVERLQKIDTGLLISTPDCQQRKRLLEWYKGKLEQKRISA